MCGEPVAAGLGNIPGSGYQQQMDITDSLRFLFGQYLSQAPTMLVCLVACLLVLSRWQQTGPGAGWALAGFGLGLVITLVLPVTQTMIQRWQIESHVPFSQVGLVYTVVGLLWAVLHAASYGLLVAGFLTGQRPPSVGAPPPLPPTGGFR